MTTPWSILHSTCLQNAETMANPQATLHLKSLGSVLCDPIQAIVAILWSLLLGLLDHMLKSDDREH